MGRGRKANAKPEPGEVVGYAPPRPAGMGRKTIAKWNQLVPLIAKLAPLRDVDADALRLYCEAVVLREKAVAELETAPLLLAGPNGAEYANPLMKIVSQQEQLIMRLSERFGLDPSSRRRLQLASEKTDGAFMEFLKRGRAKPTGSSSE